MAALFALRNGTHLGRFAVVAVFLLSFLVSGAWGACRNYGNGTYLCDGYGNNGDCSCAGNPSSCNLGEYTCTSVSGIPVFCSNYWQNGCYKGSYGYKTSVYCVQPIRCDSQEEIDSLVCINEGNVWKNGQCQGPLDSTACDSYRQECESFGGRFTGNVVTSDVSETGCLSFCDMCTSEGQELYRKSRALVCCRKGMAPPASVTSCQNLELSGSPDMSFSSFDCDNRGGYDCECEDINSDNASTYNSICNNNEWPDDTTGSGGGSDESSSSEEGSPSDTSGDWEYDYRDSLHRIIKYDSINMENSSAILSCLLSPVSCDGLNSGGDSVVVNVPSDSTILKDIRQNQQTMNTLVDTSIHNSFDYLGNVLDTSIHGSSNRLGSTIDVSLGRANDSLIDSIGKYIRGMSERTSDSLHDVAEAVRGLNGSIQNMDSANRAYLSDLPGKNASALGYGDTASTTLRGDLEGIREAIEGLGDTSGLGGYGDGYGDSLGRYRDSINKYYISDERFGELVDSTEVAWGVDSLDARWDSSYAYGLCNGDDCPPCSDDSCMGSLPANFVQRADSIARIAGDSLEASTKRQRDSLPTFWDSTFKELKQYSWFGSFDSTFLANIGAKIPNSNTCPEHCFAQDVNGTYAYVAYNMHLDWKLCRPIAPDVLNSLNAFDILKLLARVLTVVTCLSILMWEVSSRRGGGIGL